MCHFRARGTCYSGESKKGACHTRRRSDVMKECHDVRIEMLQKGEGGGSLLNGVEKVGGQGEPGTKGRC